MARDLQVRDEPPDMVPLHPLLFGGFLVFRLFGLLFVALGVLNVLRPREMTAYAIRRRAGGPIDGHIEPTPTRLMFTRLFGGLMIGIGLSITIDGV